MSFLPIIGVGAFVHRNACGNPVEVQFFNFILPLFVCFFNREFLHDHSQVILVFPKQNNQNSGYDGDLRTQSYFRGDNTKYVRVPRLPCWCFKPILWELNSFPM